MLADLRRVYEGSFADRSMGDLADYSSYLSYDSSTPSTADLTAGGTNNTALLASTTLPAITDTSTPVTTANGGSSNPFTSILTALGVGAATAAGAVAAGAINTVALQQTNAQRMAQGLPPLTANGAVMTAAQMSAAGYSTTQIAALQSQLGIEPQTLMILAAVGIGAFLLLSGGRSRE